MVSLKRVCSPEPRPFRLERLDSGPASRWRPDAFLAGGGVQCDGRMTVKQSRGQLPILGTGLLPRTSVSGWRDLNPRPLRPELSADSLIRKARAYGVIVVFTTQKPDANSIPQMVSDNAIGRILLAVTGHIPNDIIAGTGAYKSSVWRPWGAGPGRPRGAGR
jgi:hypothetical protein